MLLEELGRGQRTWVWGRGMSRFWQDFPRAEGGDGYFSIWGGGKKGAVFEACLYVGPVLGQGDSPDPLPAVCYDAPSVGSQDGNSLLPSKDPCSLILASVWLAWASCGGITPTRLQRACYHSCLGPPRWHGAGGTSKVTLGGGNTYRLDRNISLQRQQGFWGLVQVDGSSWCIKKQKSFFQMFRCILMTRNRGEETLSWDQKHHL